MPAAEFSGALEAAEGHPAWLLGAAQGSMAGRSGRVGRERDGVMSNTTPPLWTGLLGRL